MSTGLVDIMRRAAEDSFNASQYTDLKYGSVTSTDPLAVKISGTFSLPAELLVVPEYLTDHEITLGGETVLFENALKVGDKVVMIREHGGRKYFIVDRMAGD